MTESYLRSKKLLPFLKKIPRSYWKISPPNSPTGEPDIIGTIMGVTVVIEVKKPKEKPRKSQQYVLNEWARAGALVMVATSVIDIEDQLIMWNQKGGTIESELAKYSVMAWIDEIHPLPEK